MQELPDGKRSIFTRENIEKECLKFFKEHIYQRRFRHTSLREVKT
jgi:hypothetical protein